MLATTADDHDGPEAFHRDRAEHDLGDEERAGDRRAIRRGDPGRRAARDQQAQARRIEMHPAADQRRGERRQLHHRTFAADRAAARNREQRRHAAPEAQLAPARRRRRSRRLPCSRCGCSCRRDAARSAAGSRRSDRPRPAARCASVHGKLRAISTKLPELPTNRQLQQRDGLRERRWSRTRPRRRPPPTRPASCGRRTAGTGLARGCAASAGMKARRQQGR